MTPLTDDQRALVEAHADLPAVIAKRRLRFKDPAIDCDEVVSDAQWALVTSASRYEAEKGAAFKGFAWQRMDGTVLNTLMARKVRRGWSRKFGRQMFYVVSEDLAHDVPDNTDLQARVLMREFWDWAAQTLSARERTILRLAAHGCTLRQVGERVGLSYSRVRQILQQRLAQWQAYACLVLLVLLLPVSAHAQQKDTIACPLGAVDIAPGQDIQSYVDLWPEGSTFCLRSGVHPIAYSLTPKSGDTFIGEYGAILDGTGWTSSDTDDAALRAIGVATSVTIRNLVIRNMPQNGVKGVSSAGWIVEDSEIASNGRTGVAASTNWIVRRSNIHHNAYGNYSAFQADGARFEDNEIANGGNEQKIVDAANVVFLHNWVHHNNNGIWYDAAKHGIDVENNVVEDNASEGIFIEQSPTDVSSDACGTLGVVRGNTVRRNGVSGILASISKCLDISLNTLTDNLRGLNYFLDCQRLNGTVDDLTHVYGHDNDVTVSQSGQLAASFGYLASTCTSTTIAPYLGGLKDLTFQHNTYHAPDAGSWWAWGPSLKSWAQWQAIPQDADSTLNGNGPPPPPPADTELPVVALSSIPSGKSGNVSVSFRATDNVGVVAFAVTVDNGTQSICTVNPCSLTLRLSRGSHTFSAWARDLAGNTKTATSGVIVSTAAK